MQTAEGVVRELQRRCGDWMLYYTPEHARGVVTKAMEAYAEEYHAARLRQALGASPLPEEKLDEVTARARESLLDPDDGLEDARDRFDVEALIAFALHYRDQVAALVNDAAHDSTETVLALQRRAGHDEGYAAGIAEGKYRCTKATIMLLMGHVAYQDVGEGERGPEGRRPFANLDLLPDPVRRLVAALEAVGTEP